MKLVEVNWHPTDRQLRQFGAICFVALPAIAWIWGSGGNSIVAFALAGAALAIAGMLFPKLLKPVFVALMVVTTPIGIVISELALLMIYFGCFLPMGLLFRVMKRDSLNLKLDPSSATYWAAKKKPANVASYYRQS